MRKNLCFTVLFAGLLVLNAQGEDRTLDLSKVSRPVVTAHVDGKPAPVPQGTSVTVTPAGIDMKYVFPSKRHDACMAEFPVNEPGFNTIVIKFKALNKGHRPFLVLTDRNDEKHYFSIIDTNNIPGQAVRNPADYTRTVRIRIRNKHINERFAWRWGGDNNQQIDFPVKKIMLGMNDYPDEFTGSGEIIFNSITFRNVPEKSGKK